MSDSVKSLPRIGDVAPDFEAVTTQGKIVFSQWQQEHWVLLFSHPADFTPVCSTELGEFASRGDEFVKRNTKLIGLSIDSIHSHLAWVENLRTIAEIHINYPLIADVGAKVASLYGMIHPGESSTVTVRCLFAIDPSRKIRSIIYYPLNVGRSVDEVIRMLDALQTTDEHGVACPVNWQPGESVIVPPPTTEEEVLQRYNSDYDRLDFYLCRKKL